MIHDHTTPAIRAKGPRLGIGVWSFRYVWEPPGVRHIGVMADEVLPVVPEAVKRHPSGWLMVDYGRLSRELERRQ
jgi:hypothetical protein